MQIAIVVCDRLQNKKGKSVVASFETAINEKKRLT